MDQNNENNRDPDRLNLDEEMERDTEIRRETQVRGSLGVPPSGERAHDDARDEAVPEFQRKDDLDRQDRSDR